MCGTDLQNYRRPRDQAPYMPSLIGRPPIAGHEPAGIVCAVGTAVPPAQARVGERVMVHHYQGCTRRSMVVSMTSNIMVLVAADRPVSHGCPIRSPLVSVLAALGNRG